MIGLRHRTEPPANPSRPRVLTHLKGTVATQIVTMALAIGVLPLAARQWSPADFGRYSLTYRLLALIQPAVSLSANVSVTRFLARLGRSDREATSSVLLGAGQATAVALVPVTLLLLLFSSRIGRTVFGEPGQGRLIVCLAVLTVASTVQAIFAGALRGAFRIGLSNTLILLYTGVIPLLALLLFHSPSWVLAATAVGWTLSSVCLGIVLIARPSRTLVANASSALLRFGGRRVPGELAAFGLLTLPAILAANRSGLRYGGFVSLGMSLVTMVGALFTPLSTVLLPYLSAEFAGARASGLRLRPVLAVANGLILLSSLVMAVVMPTLVDIAFGSRYASAVAPMRIACIAVPAYASYVTMRSVLDAYYERALSMRFAIFGFFTFALSYLGLRTIRIANSELLAFDAGVWMTACLTAIQTLRVTGSRPLPTSLPSAVIERGAAQV